MQVIVTCNLFGDILTDIGAALQGGLGLAGRQRPRAGALSRSSSQLHGSAASLSQGGRRQSLSRELPTGGGADDAPPRSARL